MNIISSWVNFGFAWFIVCLAIIGYVLTIKRMKEKWMFWIVLAVGWAFFAIAQTLLLAGVNMTQLYSVGLYLSSYILVIASLTLLFIKLISKANLKS